MPFLSQIFIYPIKSLAGIPVDHWELSSTGLKYDRKWMLVDEQQQFLSQRRLAKMALLKTQMSEQQLIISAPNQTDLVIMLEMPVANITREVMLWGNKYQAQEVNQEANQWFSDFLTRPCTLVYQPNETIRSVDQRYAQANDQTSFSDGFPFLIATTASLAKLNQQMNLSLSMRRFRPNLVITDCPSYAEDNWRKISIGDIDFRLPKPCSRCSIPQINPQTALLDKEPLRTLARTRKWNNKVFFGQNALHDNLGVIHVGDSVVINESGASQPPLA